MPVNIGLTFLIGGILGWIAVKILKPKPHLEGLIIATCSSGNFPKSAKMEKYQILIQFVYRTNVV